MNSWQKWQNDLMEREAFRDEERDDSMPWWLFGLLVGYAAGVVGLVVGLVLRHLPTVLRILQ